MNWLGISFSIDRASLSTPKRKAFFLWQFLVERVRKPLVYKRRSTVLQLFPRGE